MPGKLKVRVMSARNLPVMDRSTDLTDAFVEIRFRNEFYKTDVVKRSLNPQWNSEWFKFEGEDDNLQDEPLELRVLDHDTYSAHDAIGKVYVDLNPLLTKDSPNLINGWFPLYDTMHGIRGELHIMVKIELFSDFNKFRQSSCGIQFFSTAEVPYGYKLQVVHGFVEELVVNDDPEYQWIDKLRTPRASNEARQRLFSKLSGELQRKVGLKVLELGGNSVIGYFQCFDLEGESGIVVRSIGTAVTLTKFEQRPMASPLGVSPLPKDFRHSLMNTGHHHIHHSPLSRSLTSNSYTPPHTPVRKISAPVAPPSAPPTLGEGNQSAFSFPCSSPVPEESLLPSSPPASANRSTTSPVKVSPAPPSSCRRPSSDSDLSNNTPPRDVISTPQKVRSRGKPVRESVLVRSFSFVMQVSRGNSLTESSGSGSCHGSSSKAMPKLSYQQPSIDMMEYPFFTMTAYPQGFIVHLWGVVSARSVKLLDKIHNPDEPETRDNWWTEIRTEIRSHMKAVGCHAVLGYSESTTICDEIIVLSAIGTAAKVSLSSDTSSVSKTSTGIVTSAQTSTDKDKDKKLFVDVNLANQHSQNRISSCDCLSESPGFTCSLCHIPYKKSSLPFTVSLSACAVCKRKSVPDVLFTTIEPPDELQIIGKGSLIQARICRPKPKSKGEMNAKEISDSLPFLEYELHNQLMNKLKLRGMNGLFGLRIQISVGENLLVGIATATATFLAPLPTPPVPKVTGQAATGKENIELQTLQKEIVETVARNKEKHDLQYLDTGQTSPRSIATEDSDDDLSDLDLSANNKEAYILEVDDTKDQAISSLLNDFVLPEGFDMLNTCKIPGNIANCAMFNLQMFNYVWRSDFEPGSDKGKGISDLFESIVKRICFKLRKLSPCCLCKMDFNVEIPDEDEIQVTLTGVCIGMNECPVNTMSLPDLSNSGSKMNFIRAASSNDAVPDQEADMMFPIEEVLDSCSSQTYIKACKVQKESMKKVHTVPVPTHCVGIEITPLPYVHGGKIEKYLGNYNFFFIRETTSLREMGGDGGFVQSFIAEVLANVRAYVGSLGGNGLVAYRMNDCVLLSNPHKNQSQCLINVSGDVVTISYDVDLGPTDTFKRTGESPIVVTVE